MLPFQSLRRDRPQSSFQRSIFIWNQIEPFYSLLEEHTEKIEVSSRNFERKTFHLDNGAPSG